MFVSVLKSHSSTSGSFFSQFDVKTSNFKCGSFTVLPNCESIVDCHEVKECWFIVEGMGELLLNGESKSITAGDMLFFNSFDKHQLKNISSEAIKIFSIWWHE